MISIVVPVFNEQESIPELYRRISEVMRCIGMSFELIIVDDGSTDGSLKVALELHQKDRNVKVLEFSRNFGHQMAIAAGLDYARGEAVITMDGDLQHPPELIPAMIDKWQAGYDVVFTCRKTTADTGLLKDVSSRLFYALFNRLSDVSILPGAADFRLLDRQVVEVLKMLSERALFYRGLLSWVGYRQTAVYYEASARYGGESKYRLTNMWRFAIHGITSFSSVPLYFSAIIGLIISAVSFVYAAFSIYARLFTNRVVEGWTSVIVTLLFLGGIQLVTLGILGTYIGRIYDEVKRRPRYLARRAYGFEE